MGAAELFDCIQKETLSKATVHEVVKLKHGADYCRKKCIQKKIYIFYRDFGKRVPVLSTAMRKGFLVIVVVLGLPTMLIYVL